MMKAIELVQVVEAVRRIPPDQRPGVTYFSMYDVWLFQAVMDERTCQLCLHYETAYEWRGDQLRTEFPYLEITDENTIKANVHPNCRCYLMRQIGYEEPPLLKPELTIRYPGEFDENSTMIKRVRDTFDKLPKETTNLVDDVYVYPTAAQPTSEHTGGKVAGRWHAKERMIQLWGDEPTQYTDEVVEHEAAHAVYDDMEKRRAENIDKWNDLINEKIDDMKAQGAPWFKYEDLDWEGPTINTVVNQMRKQQDEELQAIGIDEFKRAIKEEGPPTDYATEWKDHPNYHTECFAETTMCLMSDNPWIFNQMAYHPQTFEAWKNCAKHYKLRMEI